MMTWKLKHHRPDGTFVVELDGLPYHVEKHDALYAEVAAAAEGVDLPPEPVPEPDVLPPPPQPSKAELMAQLAAIQAQIHAL